jgi:hypothetical protein
MNLINQLFTGLDIVTKKCGMCLEEKPLGAFGRDGGAKYLRYECKECASKQAKLLKKIKNSVIPPPTDYKCPICNRTEEQARGHNIKNRSMWCADHNHDTNQFRGWLCHKCNLGLGNFADDMQRLKSAMEYLENHERRH